MNANFFISYLRKGTYVFEYPIRVTHKGKFQQRDNQYPMHVSFEFTSHSEGIRVKM
ncbi:MAG: hypothetical protein IPI31_03230 [Bacteroidetes bacterium]|nr:hypothetical protein [Bacteroidota bacterium]